MNAFDLAIIRHRGLIGLGLAVLGGFAIWDAYRLGLAIGTNMTPADAAKAASEALGG